MEDITSGLAGTTVVEEVVKMGGVQSHLQMIFGVEQFLLPLLFELGLSVLKEE